MTRHTPKTTTETILVTAASGALTWAALTTIQCIPTPILVTCVTASTLNGTISGTQGIIAAATDRKQWKSVVETLAYYNNPLETWAYKKDDNWPPQHAHPTFTKKKPHQPQNIATNRKTRTIPTPTDTHTNHKQGT